MSRQRSLPLFKPPALRTVLAQTSAWIVTAASEEAEISEPGADYDLMHLSAVEVDLATKSKISIAWTVTNRESARLQTSELTKNVMMFIIEHSGEIELLAYAIIGVCYLNCHKLAESYNFTGAIFTCPLMCSLSSHGVDRVHNTNEMVSLK